MDKIEVMYQNLMDDIRTQRHCLSIYEVGSQSYIKHENKLKLHLKMYEKFVEKYPEYCI